MTGFSPATFSAVADEVSEGIIELEKLVKEFGPNARAALEKLAFDPIVMVTKDYILWCVDKIVDIMTSVLEEVREAVKGLACPIVFWKAAMDWPDLVGVPASRVASATIPSALEVTDKLQWTGDAADRYSKAVADQPDAAEGIQSLSESMRSMTMEVAIAGGAFYAAVVGIVAGLIVTEAAAAAAIASAVAAPEGAAAGAAEAGISWGAMAAAVAGIGALADALLKSMSSNKSAIASNVFPDGHWPRGSIE